MAANLQGKTLEFFRDRGSHVDSSTRWVPVRGDWTKGVRRDLFRLFDSVAIVPGGGIVGIQVCSRGGMAAHRDKALAQEVLLDWLKERAVFELWGWTTDGTYKGRSVLRAKVERFGIVDGKVAKVAVSFTDDPNFYLGPIIRKRIRRLEGQGLL